MCDHIKYYCVSKQTKRPRGTADEAIKAVHGQLNRGAGSPFPKKGGKEEKKGDSKKGVSHFCNVLIFHRKIAFCF